MKFEVLMNARHRIRTVLALTVLALAGCGKGNDPHWRVSAYHERLESDLRREVGPPTHERLVAATEKGGPCSSTSGVAERELMYDIPSGGTAKRVRGMFRMSPFFFRYVVCVDHTGRIVGITTVQID
jgi:hypothetical protein